VTSLGTIAFGIATFAAGVILVYGSRKRWNWLVDPPEELWPIYSQAFLKKLVGTDEVAHFTYVFGLNVILFAIAITAVNVWRIVNG
jgi:hypothetical protein